MVPFLKRKNHSLQEILFSGKTSQESRKLKELLVNGKVRKLLPRVYTSNLTDKDSNIVLRNWQMILAHLFPGALLSHRSAIEFQPSDKNNIYLTHKSRRVLKWPGLNVRMVAGPPPLHDDNALYEALHVASLERACLENLAGSRTTEGEKRTLPQEDIEQKLLQILNTHGEKGLNKFRTRAKEIAGEIGREKEYKKLNLLISAILSTQTTNALKSDAAKATSLGRAYDTGRIKLFTVLITYLNQCTFEDRLDSYNDVDAYHHLAFLEAYFSNYIEGTTFVVEEAEEIIFRNKKVKNRSRDAHDIRGTFHVCSDYHHMKSVTVSSDIFIELLQKRHATIMAGRPDKNPGEFKTKANRAGSSYFVEPTLVLGTLEQGFKLLTGVRHPLAKAIYMMFLISEVHPFDDGNGRIARIMMNGELVANSHTKLIIPTVYREDYMLNLKVLTKKHTPKGFVKMMDRAHSFTHWLKANDLQHVKDQLTLSNAFKESDEASLLFPIESRSVIV